MRVLRRALELLGSERALAEKLRIARRDLALFLDGTEVPTKALFLAMTDILIEHGEASNVTALAASTLRDDAVSAERRAGEPAP